MSVTPELPWAEVTQATITLDADYSVEEIVSHLAIIGGGVGSEKRIVLTPGTEHAINCTSGYMGYLDKLGNSLVYSTPNAIPSVISIEWL